MTEKTPKTENKLPESSQDDSIDTDEHRDRLKDISHTPPAGDGANRVWDGTRVYDKDADDDE